MIESARPKPSRFKYAAMLAGAMAVVAFPSVGLAAVATAQAGTWDIEEYDDCYDDFNKDGKITNAERQYCCEESGGVWHQWDFGNGYCSAPPADTQGSRQLPGNIQIPPDISTAPTVTKDPPRPIRVPSDIATVSTVSQGNELAT